MNPKIMTKLNVRLVAHEGEGCLPIKEIIVDLVRLATNRYYLMITLLHRLTNGIPIINHRDFPILKNPSLV